MVTMTFEAPHYPAASALDDTDRRILLELDHDPRMTVLLLAQRTGLARGTVQARLDRYRAAGLLRLASTLVPPSALGRGLSVRRLQPSGAVGLGDASATALGVRVDRTRILLVLAAVALACFATATTGPIAFVAVLAGPIAARIVGPGAPVILPAALTGAVLVLAADLLGQFAFDTKFPVGVITGILGAPYLLYLLIRTSRRGGSS